MENILEFIRVHGVILLCGSAILMLIIINFVCKKHVDGIKDTDERNNFNNKKCKSYYRQ